MVPASKLALPPPSGNPADLSAGLATSSNANKLRSAGSVRGAAQPIKPNKSNTANTNILAASGMTQADFPVAPVIAHHKSSAVDADAPSSGSNTFLAEGMNWLHSFFGYTVDAEGSKGDRTNAQKHFMNVGSLFFKNTDMEQRYRQEQYVTLQFKITVLFLTLSFCFAISILHDSYFFRNEAFLIRF